MYVYNVCIYIRLDSFIVCLSASTRRFFENVPKLLQYITNYKNTYNIHINPNIFPPRVCIYIKTLFLLTT